MASIDINPEAVDIIIAVFLGAAIYSFLELNLSSFSTFKRRSGLYFWSFTIATWGIAFNSVGYLLRHFGRRVPPNVYATFILIGWCTMITGQSVVLYSRLHIVLHKRAWLRAVLIMIIVNATWLHLPIIILVYGVNSSNPSPFETPYSIFEKIQLSVFCVQELIISGLYVWETIKFLRQERTLGNTKTRQVMSHLTYVNIFIILLDFTILGLEFAGLYDIQTAWKPLVYSIKLKLEFAILNRLVDLTRNGRSGNSYSHSRTGQQNEGVALSTLKRTAPQRSMAHDVDELMQYEVHVGRGTTVQDPLDGQKREVKMTTEIQIQTQDRRRSNTSLAESGTEILAESKKSQGVETGSASSISSEVHYPRYDSQPWKP
jgi:hypothetical protein